MQETLLNIWQFILKNPLQVATWLLLAYLEFKLILILIRSLHRYYQDKNLVFLKVILPRDDSPKDKDKDNEKDFREKISVMSQFYRNLHETIELNAWNNLKVRLFKHNVFSFELERG